MTCMCGDSECPSCGLAQGTLTQPFTDDDLGMAWWNGLTKPERRHWLDLAWRRNERVAGHSRYTLDDMPSAADAWATFKESGSQLNDGPHG